METTGPWSPRSPPSCRGSRTPVTRRRSASAQRSTETPAQHPGQPPWQQQTNIWRGLTSLPHRLTRPTSEEAQRLDPLRTTPRASPPFGANKTERKIKLVTIALALLMLATAAHADGKP